MFAVRTCNKGQFLLFFFLLLAFLSCNTTGSTLGTYHVNQQSALPIPFTILRSILWWRLSNAEKWPNWPESLACIISIWFLDPCLFLLCLFNKATVPGYETISGTLLQCAHAQFCRFDKADATTEVQWHYSHRPFTIFFSSEHTGCGYPGLLARKNRSSMCADGSRTFDFQRGRWTPYPPSQALLSSRPFQ